MSETTTSKSEAPKAPPHPAEPTSIAIPMPKKSGEPAKVGSFDDFASRQVEFMKQAGIENPSMLGSADPSLEVSLPFNVGDKPKEPSKTDAQTPADESQPPKGPGSHKRWDELKAKEKRLAEIEKAHAEAEKERNELRKWREEREKMAAVSQEEYDKLKKEREAIAEELKAVDITRDPEFQREIVVPLQRSLVEALDHIPAEMQQLARSALTAPTRAEMAKRIHEIKASEKLEEWQIDALRNYGQDIFPRMMRYRDAIENASSLAERRDAERAAKARQQEQFRQRTFETQLQEAFKEESIAPLFKGETDEQKQLATQRVQQAREIFGALDNPEHRAAASIWAVIGPEVLNENVTLKKKLAATEAKKQKVQALEDTNPDPGGFSGESKVIDSKDNDMSPDAILRRAKRFGLG